MTLKRIVNVGNMNRTQGNLKDTRRSKGIESRAEKRFLQQLARLRKQLSSREEQLAALELKLARLVAEKGPLEREVTALKEVVALQAASISVQELATLASDKNDEKQSTKTPVASLRYAKRAIQDIKNSGVFDDVYYRTKYLAGTKNIQDAVAHYVLGGAAQGFNPSPLFHTAFYSATYPDVPEAKMNPLHHFILSGARELRDPHPLFSTATYVEMFPDSSGELPILHYIKHPETWDRDIHPAFRAEYYRSAAENSQRDLNLALPSPRQVPPLLHFLEHGRQLEVSCHPAFDMAYYLRNNPDLVACGDNPLIHYLMFGAREGRKSSPIFSAKYYMEADPYTDWSKINPFLHYLVTGEREGRNPGVFFDVNFYTSAYRPGCDNQGALEHFLTIGYKRGYNPSPRLDFAYYWRQQFRSKVPLEAMRHFFTFVVENEPIGNISPDLYYWLKEPTKYPDPLRARQTSSSPDGVLGISYFAPLRVVSGLGMAARGYAKALTESGIIVYEEHLKVSPFQKSLPRPVTFCRRDWPIAIAHVNADTTFHFLGTREGQRFLQSQYRIGLWVWEMASFPQEWRVNLAPFDEIWVPSTFCAEAVKSVTKKPVIVVPHVVEYRIDTTPETPSARLLRLRAIRSRWKLPERSYVFSYIFDVSSYTIRKNPLQLVECFLEVFAGRSDATLLLKAGHLAINKQFRSNLQSLLRKYPNAPVRIIESSLTDAELEDLWAITDCYVSPHRAEGFGLTIAEALVRGIRVIATDYSGPRDFLESNGGKVVGWHPSLLKKSFGPYLKGALWAEPDKDALKTAMLEMLGTQRRSPMSSLPGHSAKEIGTIMRERLEEISKSLR